MNNFMVVVALFLVWGPLAQADLFKDYDFRDELRQGVLNPTNKFKDMLDKYAGWRVGNGGDGLRLTFIKAKENAAHITQRMNAGAIDSGTSSKVVEFILQYKDELAADILASRHVWVPEDQFSCAWTQTPKHFTDEPVAAEVLLSYPRCRDTTTDLAHAVFLLIHESVHHFGIEDEAFADAVAFAIVDAWKSGKTYWQATPKAPEGSAREGHAAAFSGGNLYFYGGLIPQRYSSSATLLKLNLTSLEWTKLESDEGPSRYGHNLHPYKNKLVVWGGFEKNNGRQSWKTSGATYNISTKEWKNISSPQAFKSKELYEPVQQSVIAGDGLVVWGGAEGGFIYDLEGGNYLPIADTGAPFRSSGHSLTFAGSSVIVWGGKDLSKRRTNAGAVYNLLENKWSEMTQKGAPPASSLHTALWTGSKLIVYGGFESTKNLKGTGGIYDPKLNRWQSFEAESAIARVGHQAVWTGAEMIVYGGKSKRMRNYLGDVMAFNPSTMSWRVVNSINAPAARANHSMVWAGGKLAIWGGQDKDKKVVSTGGFFYP